jgi:hypothetical protein
MFGNAERDRRETLKRQAEEARRKFDAPNPEHPPR